MWQAYQHPGIVAMLDACALVPAKQEPRGRISNRRGASGVLQRQQRSLFRIRLESFDSTFVASRIC
jgi:hypothetical protein